MLFVVLLEECLLVRFQQSHFVQVFQFQDLFPIRICQVFVLFLLFFSLLLLLLSHILSFGILIHLHLLQRIPLQHVCRGNPWKIALHHPLPPDFFFYLFGFAWGMVLTGVLVLFGLTVVFLRQLGCRLQVVDEFRRYLLIYVMPRTTFALRV